MIDRLPWRAWLSLYTEARYIWIQRREHGPPRTPGNPNKEYEEDRLSTTGCSLDGVWYEEIAYLSSGPCPQIPSDMPRTGP